ncbi:hypothetical protein MBAV_005975 [Candidatus Magnetobacterium bavaricum]|uniref:Uncharacterized protein n=1 Tax=Candidatus Magnetobacterium bavaricum TaxID=29290 RepID=A0A0F3GJ40_9BACT|nr:hypothetical protein MBAV_005975 [Candidatus Magnetobacterium bavaricum]
MVGSTTINRGCQDLRHFYVFYRMSLLLCFSDVTTLQWSATPKRDASSGNLKLTIDNIVIHMLPLKHVLF